MVSEYIADICVYFKEIEVRIFTSLNPQPLIFPAFQVATLPNRDYMTTQMHITWDHRGFLLDWLLLLHANYNVFSESLFLCVNLLDRFLGLTMQFYITVQPQYSAMELGQVARKWEC